MAEQTHESDGDDMLAQLRRWNEQIKALPEPVAYIVLDHSWSHKLPVVKGHDAKGRLYVLTSPAVLDELEHRRISVGGLDVRALISGEVAASGLLGIPVYRREDMAEEWPDA